MILPVQLFRRSAAIALLLGAAGASALLSPAAAQEQQPAAQAAEEPSQEKVFLDYTQQELDDAYNQRVWAPNAGEIIESWAPRSAEARERFARDTYRYGPTDAETVDIFRTDRGGAPTLIFIHGGAWRAGGKDDYSLLADAIVPYGANLAVLNFANIPDERIPGMAEQVRRAIAWLHANAPAFGADPDKLYVTGHSSGGQLAAVMLTTDWAELGLPGDVIKGGLPISGMFDLEPVKLSARSDYIELDEAEEEALSPIRHIHRIRAPIVLAYGGKESPEFQRHSRDFHEALRQVPYPSELIVLPDLNHFEMMNNLADPEGEVARAARRMMGLVGEGR